MIRVKDVVLVDCSNCGGCSAIRGRPWHGVVKEVWEEDFKIQSVHKNSCICRKGYHLRKKLRIGGLVEIIKAPSKHRWMKGKEAIVKWIDERYHYFNRKTELSYILEFQEGKLGLLWDCKGFVKSGNGYILPEEYVEEIKVNKFRLVTGPN